jgi:PAS domain S-box-containing protein
MKSGDAANGTLDIHALLVASVREYAIFVLDRTGHVMTWNVGAERLKGYTTHEIVGQHFSIFYTQEEIDRGHPAEVLAEAEAKGSYSEEGWRLRKDRTPFWASVTVTALRDDEATLIGYAKVTRDLTDRRAAELKAIEDARKVAEAESANRAKSDFLATMSHELRTPLNAIGGYVDLLTYGVHGQLTEAQLGALARVRRSQQHLLTLINDLLNFSEVEAGRIPYDLEPFPLAEVAGSVAPIVDPQAAAKDIVIDWQTGDDAVIALADRYRVEQILLNLVTNAVRYTGPGGHIEVRYYRRGGEAVIEVSDSGIGILPEFMEAIFEPFTQLGRTLTSAHEGTGLGLAISRDLARGMGGDLTVRSTVGVGSTFTLVLSAAP